MNDVLAPDDAAPEPQPGATQDSRLASTQARQQAVAAHKRELILQAARAVFERDGLEGANMRAIAQQAGYAVGALYNHYASKEALYGELLTHSLQRLHEAVQSSCPADASPVARIEAHALAFFHFYQDAPRELELGFYLFQGLRPRGLTPELNRALNQRLAQTLAGIEHGLTALGADQDMARAETTALFGHAVGLLVLVHTGRIRPFGQDAQRLFKQYVRQLLERRTL